MAAWSSSFPDHVETGVRLQRFWYADALRRLVVLQDRRHDPRQRECAAVQRVRELRLLVLTAVAQLQAIALEGLEAADRAHFQPAFLRTGIYFHVVGHRAGEAH